MKITKQQACNFLVRYHHLSDDTALSGKDGILKFFSRIGSVQYDPLNVVGRNADLVLQSRVANYCEEMLHGLLYTDRLLIDGWDKMMGIYHLNDWAYFYRVRKAMVQSVISTLRNRGSLDALDYLGDVLAHIAQNGASVPKDIKLGQAKAGTWGHKSVSGVALDYLWHEGKVGVANKNNANKTYDLIENLLPTEILDAPDPFATDDDFVKWYVLRRIGSIGLLWNKSGSGWLGEFLNNKAVRGRALDEHIKEGTIQEVEIEGIAAKFYVKTEYMSLFEQNNPTTMRFIAPLDNLIWDREMIASIFGFKYQWEVYTPVAKRKYGYYVLPVLHNNRFIARFEPEKDKTHLLIKNWWWEEGVVPTDEIINAVMLEIERFAACFGKELQANIIHNIIAASVNPC